MAALLLIALGTAACSNRDGAGGTTDGTNADAYELGSAKHLAPAMGDAPATPADSTKAVPAAADTAMAK